MFGLFTIFLVHFTLFASLRRQVIERARLTAINVGDNAAGYLFKNNAKGLRELLLKHVNQPEVAYIIVQNRAGKIFAHSLDILPGSSKHDSLGRHPGREPAEFSTGRWRCL